MKSLQHLMFMGTHGYVANNQNETLVTESNLEHLRGLPILFISGSENVVYTPETTEKSYENLRDAFGEKGYQREVFQGYGHLDCFMGTEAARDIYPRLLMHAQQCAGAATVPNGH